MGVLLSFVFKKLHKVNKLIVQTCGAHTSLSHSESDILKTTTVYVRHRFLEIILPNLELKTYL